MVVTSPGGAVLQGRSEDGCVAKKLRSDTQRTRDRMLDAMEVLLEEHGLDFSLPDLAREAGVATATVYRHFDDLADLRAAFYERVVATLVAEFESLALRYRGLALFEQICFAWVDLSRSWAKAATFIRSAEGYLERVRAGDPLVVALHERALGVAIDQLIEDGAIPRQDRDYAILLWITIFDERVVVDLTSTLAWSIERVAAVLQASLLAALRSPSPAETSAALAP